MGAVPLWGNCERGKLSTCWEVPSLAGRSTRTEGELRRRVQQPVCRGQSEERPAELVCPCCHLTLPSLRHSPAWDTPWLGWAGAGTEAQALEVRHRVRTGVGCLETAWGARVWCTTTNGIRKEAWVHQRGKVPLLWGTGGERQDCYRSSFLFMCSQEAGYYLHRLQWQAWDATAISISKGRHRPLPPLRIPQLGGNHRPCLPGNMQRLGTCTPPIKGIKPSTS